jgi:hypothetical protein
MSMQVYKWNLKNSSEKNRAIKKIFKRQKTLQEENNKKARLIFILIHWTETI